MPAKFVSNRILFGDELTPKRSRALYMPPVWPVVDVIHYDNGRVRTSLDFEAYADSVVVDLIAFKVTLDGDKSRRIIIFNKHMGHRPLAVDSPPNKFRFS